MAGWGERVWGGSLVPESAGMQLVYWAIKVIREVLLSADKDFMTGDGLTGVRSRCSPKLVQEGGLRSGRCLPCWALDFLDWAQEVMAQHYYCTNSPWFETGSWKAVASALANESTLAVGDFCS